MRFNKDLSSPEYEVQRTMAHRQANPIASAYQDFVDSTSLLGVQHFLRKKNFVWLVAYLFCVSMSIVQSWSVTMTFFQQATFHTTTVSSMNLMPFPSVTVCSNIVLEEEFDFSVIPGFNTTVHEILTKDCSNVNLMNKLGSVVKKNRQAVMRYMRKLSDEERLKLGVHHKKFVKKCKFEGRKCNFSDPKEVHIFSHPNYGNCFTMNPAFDEESSKYIDLDDKLSMAFRLLPHGYWLTNQPRNKAMVYVHSPGSAPIMNSPEVEDVFGGQKAGMSVVLQKVVTTLKKRVNSAPSCVDSEDQVYRQRSRYYRTKSPYKYSLEACMNSCSQDRAGIECKTINDKLPLQSAEYEKGKVLEKDSECRPKQPLNMEVCECPIPCTRMEYQIIRDHNELNNIPCQKAPEVKFEESHHDHHTEKKNDYLNEGLVSVKFHTNIYEKVDEKLACGLPEYLGILGGNMSLWIGLCIISLLELVELAINLVVAALLPSVQPKQRFTSHIVVKRRTLVF